MIFHLNFSVKTLIRRPMIKQAFSLTLLTSLSLGAFASNALASEAEAAPTNEESCLPTKGMKDAMAKFDGLDADQLDTVRAGMSLSIETKESILLPKKIEFRDGDEIVPLTLDPDTKTIALTSYLPSLSDESRLCIVHPTLDGEEIMWAKYGVGLEMSVRFQETPGTHTLSEIEDGLKDGRAHYKKMAGAMGFMVPKFDHVAVGGNDPENPPKLWATKNGEDIAEPEGELMNGGRLVSVKDLEKMGADGIRIEGDYRLSPSPDAKTVEKFSGK